MAKYITKIIHHHHGLLKSPTWSVYIIYLHIRNPPERCLEHEFLAWDGKIIRLDNHVTHTNTDWISQKKTKNNCFFALFQVTLKNSFCFQDIAKERLIFGFLLPWNLGCFGIRTVGLWWLFSKEFWNTVSLLALWTPNSSWQLLSLPDSLFVFEILPKKY